LLKTAVLSVSREVWRCHARTTSFLFPETEALLDAESGEITVPHNISYSQSDLLKQILCE
jgi:hypothetical protein